jgi:hypothetical protein
MFRVTYAGESFLTGEAIGDAVLSYARKLAINEHADTVSIPGLLEDGSPTTVELLIGPASQIVLAQVDSDHPDPIDASVVEELTRRAESLELPNAVPMHGADVEELPSDTEFG